SYIVGKLFVAILQAIDGPLTQENFLEAARRRPYDIGGIRVDFTNDNQGSDFVLLTLLQDDAFKVIEPSDVKKLLSR
ncbi:MAG: branched-chain amino acid ABC transporter substrate-binding protein, partial [Candidatus Competibacteraceae bacterium]|nr:branched-chain amino acid ABC transporter substrate-binding protein [Candidatus Competibacteraceae bacterium]